MKGEPDNAALPPQAPLPVLTGGKPQRKWQGRASLILAYLSLPLFLLAPAANIVTLLLFGSRLFHSGQTESVGAGVSLTVSAVALVLGVWGREQPGAREGRIASTFILMAGLVIVLLLNYT